ncbi:hypothetical protein Q8814_13555 [Rhodococcus sp. CC-R104]|uniref:ATP synthase protein I n=2 Tax=Rhodococcus chondri TaxID=3065941 RepID=A0ABU7JSX1_9NOCA|nr:hypothetical protein [Rhodococcus sp. CC-R104]MEE2033126.1 hypothetical protein [Rhodococcus sp. CC-R104]
MTSPDQPESNPPMPALPDSAAPMRAAVRYGILGLLALTVVASVIGVLVAGTPGLWGALLGAAVGGGFILFTALGVLLTAKLPAMTAGAVLLGTWLLKLILAIVVMVLLKPLDFYSKGALVLTIVFALIIVLGSETYGVLSQRALYVEPENSDDRGNDAP